MTKKSRVLIVDDDIRGRETLQMLLLPEGYQLFIASNGEEAINKTIEVMPDLILLDVMMPVMDGFEVCQCLRQNMKVAEIPIILITALDDRDSKLRGIEAGADDFIVKPYDRLELRARVKTITRLNRYNRLLIERSRFEWAVEQSEDGYLLLFNDDNIEYANTSARLYLNLLGDNLTRYSFMEQIKKLYRLEPMDSWINWPAPNIAHLPRYLVRPETEDKQALWLQVNTLEYPIQNKREQLIHLNNVSERMNLEQRMWSFQLFVSHKLRTPLNGLSVIQFLENDGHSDTLLQIARDSAARLEEEILNILQYVDSPKLVRHVDEAFSLQEFPKLITKIKWDLGLETVSLQIAEEISDYDLAFSQTSLEVIIRELLTNSKKFHPQQIPVIEIKIHQANQDFIKLTVEDDGRHLLEQELKRVWIPYYQSEKYFTGEVNGMGLGLTMVARLIWSNGGSCRFSNRIDDVGICIELTLPLLKNDNEPQ